MYCQKEYKKQSPLPFFQKKAKKRTPAPFIKRGGTKRRGIAILILCLFLLSSCSGMAVNTVSFFTMDTWAESTIITREAAKGKEVNDKIKEICAEIENRISNTVETSEIYQLNEFFKSEYYGLVPFYLSGETAGLLNIAKTIKESTNGAYDPNLGEIIDLWGFSNQNENVIRKLPDKNDFYPAVERINTFHFQLNEDKKGVYYYSSDLISPPKIDLGGIGKGYATDQINDYLIEAGIPNALVSFTSSILASGRNKVGNLWTVGLKDPLNPDKLCGYISVNDKFISVSGGYERFITIGNRDYCHIIDPETGYPVDNDLLCVVVVMNAQSALKPNEKFKNNGAISDALSTALYVMGKEQALKFYNTSSLDFEMILFVKKDIDDPSAGYDIIPTNVMFTEIQK